MLKALVLALTFLSAAAPLDKLTIKVVPQTLFAGGSLRLTCRVPKDPANRILDYGLPGYMEHLQRQLDGEAAPITWQFEFQKVPCGTELAYCTVVRQDNTSQTVTKEIQMADCEP